MRKLTLIILLFIFSDSHSQWVQQGLPTATGINGMYFTDSLNGWICAGRTSGNPSPGDSGIIIKTSNGGVNWIKQYGSSSQPLYAIKMADSNTGYSVGGFRKILKTINGGVNWNILPGINFGNYFADVAVINKDTFYVSEHFGSGVCMWKTTNGGVNFTGIFGGDNIDKIYFINEQTGWAIYFGFQLYKTTNSGTNWVLQKQFESAVSTIQFVDENTGWVISGSTNIQKTTNGGTNWFSQSLPPNSSGASGIFMLNKNYGWMGSISNKIHYTFNGGTNWQLYSSMPLGNNLKIFFVDSLHGWAGEYGITATTNGGLTFIQPISSTQPENYILKQNYPNPINPITTIEFSLKKSSNISLRIYNSLGKEVTQLINQQLLQTGTYKYIFNAENLTSGIYFYKLQTENFTEIRKMVLLK